MVFSARGGISLSQLAEELRTKDLYHAAFGAWARRNLEEALSYVSDDIHHILNVDGSIAPFAASTSSKVELRQRLELLLNMFDFGALVTDDLIVRGREARARMKIVYIHKPAEERLITTFRIIAHQRKGLFYRIEQYHDAAYIEAFARRVAMLKEDC